MNSYTESCFSTVSDKRFICALCEDCTKTSFLKDLCKCEGEMDLVCSFFLSDSTKIHIKHSLFFLKVVIFSFVLQDLQPMA